MAGKYQFGVIGYNFYYRHDNACGGWMPKLADYYGGRNNSDAILGLRRSIVPGTMVDSNGVLYTLSLCRCDDPGPRFQVARYAYENGEVKSVSTTFNPFWDSYGDYSLTVDYEPYFSGSAYDELYYKNNFHNAFQCCILQEIDTENGSDLDYIILFNYVPTVRYIGAHWTSRPDFEGALFFKRRKSDVSNWKWYKDNRGANNNLLYSFTPVNYSRYNIKGASNAVRNFQGFFLKNSPCYYWLIHRLAPDNSCSLKDTLSISKNSNDETYGVHCNRYNSSFSRAGNADVLPSGASGVNSAGTLLQRFFKIGSYVYFATGGNGYWLWLHRINPNTGSNDSIGTVGLALSLGQVITDCYTETSSRGVSCSAYNLDFCILEKDGSPSTSSSPDGDKIIVIFGFAGGGNHTLNDVSHFWFSTYVNWTYTYAVGALCSYLFSDTSERWAHAYAQNTIYVTNHTRASGNYVDIINTSKSDEYRLYLNSHKIVPYTSPSGKHYIIYAYCYPGKTEQLYLGYAQYIIDSQYQLRVLTNSEFKAPGNNGWGDSFGSFTNCSRIISMDLKNGHLWITFMKDSGVDVTDQSVEVQKAIAHYSYFHILAKDLIQE